MKPKIKFSHNWNEKLNQKIFTTIRRFTEKKLEYYERNLQKRFDVMLNDKKYGEARLITVQIIKFGDIPYGLKAVDTGEEFPNDIFRKFGIGSETEVLILTFKKL